MKTIDSLIVALEELEQEAERLRRIEHAARRFYTFTHGGYRWEATDERRDALYDALMSAQKANVTE